MIDNVAANVFLFKLKSFQFAVSTFMKSANWRFMNEIKQQLSVYHSQNPKVEDSTTMHSLHHPRHLHATVITVETLATL